MPDASSIYSAVPHLGDSVPSSKRVCQARLLRYDRIDGPVLPLRPCAEKLVKALHVLNLDALLQNGLMAVGGEGPVVINMGKKHRESYSCRIVELKCPTNEDWGDLDGPPRAEIPGMSYSRAGKTW